MRCFRYLRVSSTTLAGFVFLTLISSPPPAAAQSCGELGGDYCSQSGSCPVGYSSLGSSYDCNPCCQEKPPDGPSCGELGGSYCSQSTSCPAGYTSLGSTYDCKRCCQEKPPDGPSCGELGGDYCSQSTSCPAGYTSLGSTYDCKRCCKEKPPDGPSCGELGGNYCSQSGSCPAGYSSLGPSYDCNPCCKQQPPPRCGDGNCTEHCSICPQDCGACDGSGGSLGLCSANPSPCVGRCGDWTCDAGGGHTATIHCPPCPCTPLACNATDCGVKPDGCGGTVDCGSCPEGSFCSTAHRCQELPPPCGEGGPCPPCADKCTEYSATCRTPCVLYPPSPVPSPQLANCGAYASLYPDQPNACVTCEPTPVCSMAPGQASLYCAEHDGVYEITCDEERRTWATYVCQDGMQCTLTCDGETHEVSTNCGYLCTGGSASHCDEPLETCETCPQDCGACPGGDDDLHVLTYNVQFLPFDWAVDNSNPLRASLIGKHPVLKNYDAIVFEEAFDDRARSILRDLLRPEYPYQTSVLQGDPWGVQVTNGGVFIVSKWPWAGLPVGLIYSVCSGRSLSDPDCWATKGVKYVPINRLGRIHYIYGTHTDAGDDADDREARTRQMEEMRDFILITRRSYRPPSGTSHGAEIMAGDFNIKRHGFEYWHMLSTLSATAPDASGSATNHDGDWIDYVLHENRAWLQPTSSVNEVLSAQDGGCPFSYPFCPDLSDHHPVLGRFSFPVQSALQAIGQDRNTETTFLSDPSSGTASFFMQDGSVSQALAAPQPIGPSGAVESDIQTFAWTPVLDAEQYRLEVTDTFTGATVLAVTIPETSFTPGPFAVSGRQYRWSVTALRGSDSEQGAASEDQLFTYQETAIGTPVPIGPFGAVRGDYPTFSWSEVFGATFYYLEVVDVESGEQILTDLIPPTPFVTAEKPLAIGRKYRWTVAALRGSKRGPESEALEFTCSEPSGLDAPVPIGPMGAVEGQLPMFAWGEVAGADSYQLDVFNTRTGQRTLSEVVSGTSFTPATPFSTGRYRWMVRALKAEIGGPYSVTLMFECARPTRTEAR